MIRSLSAGIFGALVGVTSGCYGPPVLQSRFGSLQINPNAYVVQAGDTVESIAFRYRMSRSQLASLNPGLSQQVFPGQRVIVRSGLSVPAERRQAYGQDTYPVQDAFTDSSRQPVVVSALTPRAAPLRQDGPNEQIIEESRVDRLPQVPVAGQSRGLGGWTWPSEGEVVREYAPGQVNGQGIDIAGVPGQEILAAMDGTVIYAGRDLSDSGNLVIIRHADAVLSTYSHVKDLYVAEDDIVRGGDPVATLGWNSDRESVLHFGIRKNGKPADPMSYLPRR